MCRDNDGVIRILLFGIVKKIVFLWDKTTSKDPMFVSGDVVSTQMAMTKRRPMYVAIFFLGLYFTAMFRVYDLSMPDFFQTDTTAIKKSFIKNNKIRANVVDRHGVTMATQIKVSHLIADPQKIINPSEAAYNINSLFPEIDVKKLIKRLSNKKSRYTVIKRNITPSEQQKIHDMGIPGVDFEISETRYYPQENLASHVIGLTMGMQGVSGVMQGVSGVERYFEKYLTEANSKDLQLSIDLRVQYILKSALEKSIETFDAIGGSALVMDVKTGEILGMVSNPDFNPNNREAMKKIEKKDKDQEKDPTFNRASVGAYEPGSVFKIINTAIALETKTSNLASLYDVSKTAGIGRHRIRDYHHFNGSLSVADIMRKSSNIGSIKMAERFGPHVQEYYFRKLGLFSPQNIELSEKGQSITSPISRIRMMTMSFGHGIAVTPLQLSSAIATIVNGGYYIEPTLVKNKHNDIMNHDNSIDTNTVLPENTLSEWANLWRINSQNNRPYFQQMKNVNLSLIQSTHGERLFSQRTSDLTRYAMRLVCEAGGSGTRADVYGFPVIGKTGTAEKPSKGGGYNRKSLISSFAAVFPAQNPQYVVYVMVDEPKPNKKISLTATGAIVAAPVVKEVIEHIAPLLNVKVVNYTPTTHAVSDNMLDSHYMDELKQIKLR
jgi:cell division protein FtsI (penicillin-binding protein 3)